jgi:signal transduction histidine kinase
VLVRVRGVLLETHMLPDGVELLVSSSGKPIRALLRTPDIGQLLPRAGSELSLTGVAELTYDLSPWLANRSAVTDIRLLLRAPADIVVHNEPPWWTTRRLLMALGTTFAVALVLAAAAALLVRRVRAQAHTMAVEALAHQQVAATHQAMMDERARLAGEMHDGLQPMLSGLAFYLEAADASMPEPVPETVAEPLARARALLARVRDEFRQCIWCLHDMGRQTGDLENELRRLARVQHQWRRAEVQAEISGTPVPLPPGLARALFLASQEALENACRHGMAEHVTIHCRFHDDGLELEIADDGAGFDPAAATGAPGIHTGLASMRQRIERLGGTLDVTSSPGAGTRLIIRLASGCIDIIRDNPPALDPASLSMDSQNP